MVLSKGEIAKITNQLDNISNKYHFENPKISIIVPVFNCEKFLSRCLLSLIEQTEKNIEIIVVNDGSNDSTRDVISIFAEHDSRIVNINQEHKLQGAARNNGIMHAKGQYIGFVDADDWVDLNFYEKLYNAAKKYDADLAMADYVRIGNGKTKKRLGINQEKFVTGFQNICKLADIAKNPCPTNKIYKRTMLNDNNILWEEGVYCEDKVYTIKTIYYANGLVVVPDVYYYYYRNPNSTVKKGELQKEHRFDKKNAQIKVMNFLKEHNAEIGDKIFWIEDVNIKISKISLFKIKRSLRTKIIFVLGIPILEMHWK